MRYSAKEAQTNFYRFGYLSTNDTISNVATNDLDQPFQGKRFEILVSQKQ